MPFRPAGWLLAALLPVAVFAAEPGPFTLEQVMSAAFPSDLVAAPAGGAVAFVLDAEGARNVWLAEPPNYKARKITAYAADDGQEISGLAFTPDAKSIVFVRGGDANRQGEYPNPKSDPEGVKQEVWIVSTSGEPRKLGEGHSPAVSPKGDRVAFVKTGQIWSAPVDGGEAKQLVHARGNARGLRWSPDGTWLAFESRRGDHAFIGLCDPAAQAVRFLDPSVDDDSSPVWSPDGKRIAFIRVPATPRAIPFVPRRSGTPWSIRVADAATGEGRAVWTAKEERGSVFRDVAAASQILWSADERLIFPWEADGWTHLYSVPVAGGEAVLLTPGEFEVEHVTLAPSGKEVVFSSNQDDINRRHLWRVSTAAGRPLAVTTGSGIEWSPVMTGDGRAIAFLRSDAWRPARPAIQYGSGPPRDLAPESVPADFPERKLVTPEAVVFSAPDGMRIHGQLFLPVGLRAGARRPAVIFFHGGSRRQMLLGWHYMYYYHNAYAMNQYLASRGYIVLSVNYRSGIGYGMEFREALNYGARGASEFQDVMGAGLYMRSRADVDPERIGLWGGSYGGYLTALGLARASDLFAAGVDLHGVHDWNGVIRNFAPAYDPRTQAEVARLAFDSSPLAFVRDWRSPVLLIHGDDDRNVPFSQSVDLAEALRGVGAPFEELIFPDEVHDFLTHAHWMEAYLAASRFLDRRLAAKKP